MMSLNFSAFSNSNSYSGFFTCHDFFNDLFLASDIILTVGSEGFFVVVSQSSDNRILDCNSYPACPTLYNQCVRCRRVSSSAPCTLDSDYVVMLLWL